jgi:hypothetical protein
MLSLLEKNMSVDGLPNYAKIATRLQALLTCLVFIVWGAWATWGRFPYSVLASSIVFGPVLTLCIVATFGLWKGRMFGWVTAVLGSAAISLVLCFTSGLICIVPIAFLMFLLFPNVRNFYVRDYYE